MRRTLVFVLVTAAFTSGASADKLYLHDGRKLSGDYKRTAGSIEFTADGGETFNFTDEEADRVVRESTATLLDLQRMFYEFEELVSPALGRTVVEQRDGLEITQTATGRRITGHRMYREPVSSDRYVDEWVKYSARFEAIEGSRAYKRHMRSKHGEMSIGEYAQFPQEGNEEVGEVLKDALRSVKEIFSLSDRANKLLDTYRRKDLNFDKRIRDAKFNIQHKKTNKGRTKSQHNIQRIKNQKITQLSRIRLNADNVINRVAAMRIITVQRLNEAGESIETALRARAKQPHP